MKVKDVVIKEWNTRYSYSSMNKLSHCLDILRFKCHMNYQQVYLKILEWTGSKLSIADYDEWLYEVDEMHSYE